MKDHHLIRSLLLLVSLAILAGSLSAEPFIAQSPGMLYLPVVRGIPASESSGDLLVHGRVYDRIGGPLSGIAGATVRITSCIGGWTTHTSTLEDGTYVLIVPEAYVSPCQTLVLSASADGFAEQSAELYVADLFAAPRRDIGLVRDETMATPTSQPAGDLTVFGTVSRCGMISGGEIANATIAAEACTIAHRVQTATDASGAYTCTLPADYLSGCDTIYLHVSAAGYESKVLVLTVQELHDNPQRDICLNLAVTLPAP